MDADSIIAAFGRSVGGSLAPLDRQRELTGQMSASLRLSTAPFEQAGLFLGCPLGNERRELTSSTLLWCPRGWPPGPFISVACSRLGKRLFGDPLVFDALRNLLVLMPSDAAILTAEGTTLDRPIRRGCQLFGRRRLRLLPFPGEITEQWIWETLQTNSPLEIPIYFDESSTDSDQLAFALSDQVRIVDCRPNGKIEALVHRYHHNDFGPELWRLVHADRRRDDDPLADIPTVASWYLYVPDDERQRGSSDSSDNPVRFTTADLVPKSFLSHWTRAIRGPWPDHSELNQFDRPFLNPQRVSGPLATLQRILVQQKLLASGRLIRDRHPVVSLTEVPLVEFAKRRVYRSHLSRWDFEWFGLSIRRSVIEKMGGRPVQYELETGDEPSSGLQMSLMAKQYSGPIDWSEEREWRVEGDVDLRQIAAEDAFVFVPDKRAAGQIAPFSRWPVVVLIESDVLT